MAEFGRTWNFFALAVFENRAKESHRNRESGKFLYALMDEVGTTWKFVGLAVFEEAAPKQLVLLAEAIFCFLFASYTLNTHRNFRIPELPRVDLACSANRSDPLEPEGHILTDQIHHLRKCTLANALAGGPQNVSVIRDRRSTIKEFQFQVVDLDFTIPRGIGFEWGLVVSPYIEVTFDIAVSVHPFPYEILVES